MSSNINIQINHAHVDGVTFNLKKDEARIVLTTFLTPEILELHATLRRLAVTEQPLTVDIETIQLEMDLDTETGEWK